MKSLNQAGASGVWNRESFAQRRALAIQESSPLQADGEPASSHIFHRIAAAFRFTIPCVADASLKDLALVFLKLGTIAFGGPAAHVAMMQREAVEIRQWLTSEEFLGLIGATNLIPGPNSTELAIFIGYRKGGWKGLIVAGASFILPAFVIVAILGWVYVRFGALPEAGAFFHGVKPVIIAIVMHALVSLGRSALRSPFLAVVGLSAAVLSFAGMNELAILFSAGIVAVIIRWIHTRRPRLPLILGGTALFPAVAAASGETGGIPFGLWGLFLFFVKTGSVLFGSGYVLLAFLRADLVERWGWLTEQQLLDAVAVGQVTPGPVFTTATFIGYVLGGFSGAVVATLAIFLPAFVFVAISGLVLPRVRRSALAAGFLDGVTVASLGLMAAVTAYLARAAWTDAFSALLTVVSFVLIARFRVNSFWIVAGGAIAGLLAGR
ncbi:MAG TPA: chromate efflux transporter [Terriglobia bacterium]|nr:chromate efflux transporter [Terriglobia bacterium]